MKRLLLFVAFAAWLFVGCESDDQPVVGDGTVTIFYTSDEHGWIESDEERGGAAGMLARWRAEGYDKEGPYLIFSGGDMWTGPAIGTWYEGESIVEVFNAVGYDAAAIGNHEFDFTADVLYERSQEADFPFLAANVVYKSTTDIPEFAKPYELFEVGGATIGVIGLASLSTPNSTFPAFVEDYEFRPYDETLRLYVPKVKDEGADAVVVISHLCREEIEELKPVAKELGVSLIGGGHCHELFACSEDDVAAMGAGAEMRSYAKAIIRFDDAMEKVASVEVATRRNEEHITGEAEIDSIVAFWRWKVNDDLSDVVGYSAGTIEKDSPELQNLVVDSWLFAFPNADVAITNAGGIRQDIPKGDITLQTIVGVLPFANTILKLEMTGAEIKTEAPKYVYGGVVSDNGWRLIGGGALEDATTYTVLTTDYLYSRSDNAFQEYDADPYNTSVHFRQPLVDYLESLGTTEVDPLQNYLDGGER
jgi:2',3'-cyclic-nucleotide 2'-phosphodiesterase (5'-nucleotidase family)